MSVTFQRTFRTRVLRNFYARFPNCACGSGIRDNNRKKSLTLKVVRKLEKLSPEEKPFLLRRVRRY